MINQQHITEVFVNHYRRVFGESAASNVDTILSCVDCKVTEKMNAHLIVPYIEVIVILKQMHPTKTPELDGMSSIFFQKFWPIPRFDFVHFVLNPLKNLASFNR